MPVPIPLYRGSQGGVKVPTGGNLLHKILLKVARGRSLQFHCKEDKQTWCDSKADSHSLVMRARHKRRAASHLHLFILNMLSGFFSPKYALSMCRPCLPSI